MMQVQDVTYRPVSGDEVALPIGLENAADNLLKSMLAKLSQDGFRLKVMVVGESGLGKTTLIDTLFRSRMKDQPQKALNAKTVSIEKREVSIEENGIKLNLTVVDTPGYGDAINNEDAWQPVLDYIDVELETFMNNSLDLSLRGKHDDTRVHACLYFVAPHRLKDVDVEFMQRLTGRVNLIPVIAKADTMTTKELDEYKKLILETLRRNSITAYPQPPEDLTTAQRILPPFAVIGSNEEVILPQDIPGTCLKAGQAVAGREYPWGTACIEDNNHCDVGELRRCLVDNFIALRDETEEIYQDFRCGKLEAIKKGNDALLWNRCKLFFWFVLKGVLTTLLFEFPEVMGIALGFATLMSMVLLIIAVVGICCVPKVRDEMSLICPGFVIFIRYLSCLQIEPSRHERKLSMHQMTQEQESCEVSHGESEIIVSWGDAPPPVPEIGSRDELLFTSDIQYEGLASPQNTESRVNVGSEQSVQSVL